MSELVAIWVVGVVLLAVAFAAVVALLRFTAAGRSQRMPPGDVFKVLAVVVGLCCGVLTVLTLIA
jgi:hypothetical protein